MSAVSIEALASLLRYCDGFAHQRLTEVGDFLPFGAFLNSNGEVEALGAYLGNKAHSATEVYEFLNGTVARMVAERKAFGYAIAAIAVSPGQLGAPFPDSVRVFIEAPGYARFLYTPYRLLPMRALRKFMAVLPTVEFGEQIAVDSNPVLFNVRTEV